MRSVSPPAFGGLCRLKPAFRAGGPITAVGQVVFACFSANASRIYREVHDEVFDHPS